MKNTQDSVHKIKNANSNSEGKIVLFDADTLFPQYSSKLMKSLEKWLNFISIEKAEVEDYIKLAQICVEQNHFSFNNKFYK